jgi:hypothetical protein
LGWHLGKLAFQAAIRAVTASSNLSRSGNSTDGPELQFVRSASNNSSEPIGDTQAHRSTRDPLRSCSSTYGRK